MTARNQRQKYEALFGKQESCFTALIDEQLIQLCLGGVREAFAELCCRHERAAYRKAYQILSDDAAACDAIQEGFANAYTRLHTFQGQSSFKTWLLRVVSNAALDLGREKSSCRAHEAMIAACRPRKETCTPLHTLVDKEQQDLGIRFLQLHTTPLMRLVCELRIRDGLSYPEIAQRIEGQTARTVRHMMDQLLSKLKEYRARWE